VAEDEPMAEWERELLGADAAADVPAADVTVEAVAEVTEPADPALGAPVEETAVVETEVPAATETTDAADA
ncbi:MAG TPA: 30S ribosomal protein S2, partial [Tetrasphaera sp.]|nr:30S ribosomal protein S2 [Tetrasphaera sp.]